MSAGPEGHRGQWYLRPLKGPAGSTRAYSLCLGPGTGHQRRLFLSCDLVQIQTERDPYYLEEL